MGNQDYFNYFRDFFPAIAMAKNKTCLMFPEGPFQFSVNLLDSRHRGAFVSESNRL